MTKLIRCWFTPKFPEQHIKKALEYKPEGFTAQIRNYYRTWTVHPLKRRIVRYYVFFLQKFCGLKVVGVTGSSGKTTTKEILASILQLSGDTVYSYANIDPIYNIPTTILKCRPSTKYLILEMGVEYPTEMDFYLWLVKPRIGLITNIYPTHTLFFKNELGVFKEKSKLIKSLDAKSLVVLNSNDSILKKLEGRLSAKEVWFGEGAKIYASNVTFTKDGKTKFELNIYGQTTKIVLSVLGEQFVSNAAAAASAAYSLGVNIDLIKKGIESFSSTDHRMNIKTLKSGTILIDDSYNNNPEAAKKAIQTLKSFAGKRKTILVFGDMLELGVDEVEYHKEINKMIRRLKIDIVFGVGNLAKHICKKENWSPDWQGIINLIKPFLKKSTVILVKGSRSIGLENVVNNLH